METITTWFALAHQWLFESAVQPVMFALGFASWTEPAFNATEIFLIGAIEITLLALILGSLERWKPVERWANDAIARRDVRIDVIYTFLNRLGVVPLLIFFLLLPLIDGLDGWLRMQGFIPPKLEDALPWLNAHPLVSFATYLVILDFVGYWLHRWQHRFEWWWALHALHHSQRHMTFWSDDRNHLLDDFIVDATFAVVALVIGVPPGQFVLLLLAGRVVESLSHANIRTGFGWAEAWLVSPRFHRVHHAIGLGHEGAARGCNFAVLFPVWDRVFGTANFDVVYPPTGIRDQDAGRNYGDGFWSQQWLGVRRLWHSVASGTPSRP
ncbi:MAG: sterol desaturase family protein [Betaproteobacteria bacterium]|nr:sterol desaturase family protein [Betaproteobacteria bacterium]